MWTTIASFILRNRLPILIAVALITVFMGWQARDVRMSYKFGGLLPDNDSTYLDYKDFLESFSEDGNVIVIGVGDDQLFELEKFNAWYNLASDIRKIRVPVSRGGEETEVAAVDSVFSIAQSYKVSKDDSLQRFGIERVFKSRPGSQIELDSILTSVRNMPFYEGLLYKDNSNATLMMVFVNAGLFNSEDRGPSIQYIKDEIAAFETETGLKTYVSGLPFIRTQMTTKVKAELGLFVILAALVTAILLLLFFRNVGVMLVSILVVGIGVVWSMGTIALFDYPISMLMALIPPLMIVIGVPNCIYLINKYHAEYKRHGNKAKALSRVIHKVGNATFMTNATTALGFATFIFTHSDVMKEFGIVASLNIIAVFVVSLIIIPTIYSYLPPPKERHTKHLDRKWVFFAVNKLVHIVTNHRRWVYISTFLILLLGGIGISQMVTTGNVVDDLPQTDKVITDLRWFEDEFNGVMPFEVILDTKRKGQVTRPNTLKKLEELQELLAQYPEITRSLSIADAVKFCKQAFYNGDPDKYSLLTRQESSFIGPYFQSEYETGGMEHMFFDSTRTRTRITAQIADIGTKEMAVLLNDLRPKIDAIINPSAKAMDSLLTAMNTATDRKAAATAFFDTYPSMADSVVVQLKLTENCEDVFACAINHSTDASFIPAVRRAIDSVQQRVILTGTSVVYLEGTTYMVKNLFISLILAILVIAGVMALLFRSFRMVLISLVPNLVPLIFTAAVMGYFQIPIKPSTILVFSIAFGISVDDTIHFLAKYRQELKLKGWNIRESILLAVKETGVSMMYTSIVLFFGFGMFAASEFDGTRALGILVSMTLLIAMFSNLLLLPSLLLSFERWITTKAFAEPFLEIIDEEEDIELEELQVQKGIGLE